MPADDSAEVLVARFLRTNGYDETLESFIKEAGLASDAGSGSTTSFTIEKLLEEKRLFDLSQQFEKLGHDDERIDGWAKDAPAEPQVITVLPGVSNILNLGFRHDLGSVAATSLVATTADRKLNTISVPDLALQISTTGLQDSPILSHAWLMNDRLLTSSMSGQLSLSDSDFGVLDRRRDHSKYIVQIVVHRIAGSQKALVATAGWDSKIQLYEVDTDTSVLPQPLSTIVTPTIPESLVFVTHPASNDVILIVTRRDSSFLYYYSVTKDAGIIGRQNLAPYSNAWVAFTPSAIAASPRDPHLLAVTTSAVPHMKLIIVRLIFPDESTTASHTASTNPSLPPSILESNTDTSAAVAQARAELVLQEREAAAVQIHVTTFAPQTPYSTPALAWRPDGSGVWVNSDDGLIRGFETITGKLITTLRGHEPGSKVRCLASALVAMEERHQEWLVSGGFDQKLIVWKPTASG